jgi:hypothetical protein
MPQLSELPAGQPDKFELVVNNNAAKARGQAIAEGLRLRSFRLAATLTFADFARSGGATWRGRPGIRGRRSAWGEVVAWRTGAWVRVRLDRLGSGRRLTTDRYQHCTVGEPESARPQTVD